MASGTCIMISIIIPSLGRPSLESLVKSLRVSAGEAGMQLGVDFEILISLDVRVVSRLSMDLDDVKVVRSPGPGVNRARNEGARHGRGEIFWFLDDDTEVISGKSLVAIRQIFFDQEVEAAGGEYISVDGARWSERGYNSFCSIWRMTAGEEELEQLLGGTLAVRKSAWHQANGFDEHIEYGGAETAFVQRLKRNALKSNPAGKVLFVEELSVHHHPGARNFAEWMSLAYRQGARSIETSEELPLRGARVDRAILFLKKQNLQTISALMTFSIPYLISSRFGRLSRR